MMGIFLKEKRREIVLYAGILLMFITIFFLYNIRIDAVEYALVLALFMLFIYLTAEFVRFCRRQNKIEEIKKVIPEDMSFLPNPESLLEEKYQTILKSFYEQKMELESAGRISRQEMADYYGMWVHQIKTPIAAMHAILQSVDGEESGSFHIRELKIELFKIEQYVEMVLTYLRMEEMSSDLAFEKCSLDDILKQCIRKYSQMFILQKIKLDFQPSGETILTDEKWFGFVLEQILSNALKYTKSGTIFIHMAEKDEKKVLVVEDTGIGIQTEDIPRVFERGFTGFNGRADKKSTGIGLYLCKQIMDRLGLYIWIESEVNVGTKVYLELEREKLNVE